MKLNKLLVQGKNVFPTHLLNHVFGVHQNLRERKDNSMNNNQNHATIQLIHKLSKQTNQTMIKY